MAAAGERRHRGRAALAWVPALLVVPLAMAGAVELSQPVDKGAAMRRLMPIDIGTTWVYDVFDHGKPSGTRTRQVVGQAGIGSGLLDAVAESSHYTDYPGAGETHDLLYLGLKGDRLLQYGLFSRNDYQAIDPPAAAYELPAKAGHSWSYQGAIGSSLNLSFEAELQEVVDVTVGGRTFHGCAHFVTHQHFSGQDKGSPVNDENYQEWTCPGIGPVKTVDEIPAFDVQITEQLTEFHGVSGNWYAEAPTPVQASPTPGDALGLGSERARSIDEGAVDPTLAWSDNLSEESAYPTVSNGSVAVQAERDGEVWARDTTTGQVAWRVRLTGPIVAPISLDGQDVLVADAGKNLWSLRLTDGSARWVRVLDDIASVAPTVSGSTVVVATDDAGVTAYDLTDGQTLWHTTIPEALRSSPAAADGLVVLADGSGRVTALRTSDGRTAWTRTLDGTLAAGPTLADGHALFSDGDGVLYSLAATDGSIDWESRSSHPPGGGLAAGNGTLVSASYEVVEGRRLSDGHLLWSQRQLHTTQAPVIVGDETVSASDTGRVSVRDLATGHVTESWELPGPTPDTRPEVTVAISTVADTLVFSGTVVQAGETSTALWAYPINAAGRAPGLTFDVAVRDVPSHPSAPPILHGTSLYVPGQDHQLYVSDGRGVRSLLRSKGLQPGIALADDLLIAQRDDEIQALPLDGGDPAWTFPAASPYPGSIPAVSGDTVFVPEYGIGLAAVSATDGTPQWFQPVTNAIGTSPPLPLPGGDVVYGSGGVARYDGATGTQRWVVPDSQLFSTASYADGVVYADVVRDNHPSGLAAIDAETGRILWSHPHDDLQIIVGPVVADGVVVDTRAEGLVTAYDARTGHELWHFQLSTPPTGEPVIAAGRVAVAEQGRDEDLYQRDQRISVLDLRTGRFLAGFQPPGSGYLNTPALGSTDDGGLLVPATDTQGAAVLILEPHHD